MPAAGRQSAGYSGPQASSPWGNQPQQQGGYAQPAGYGQPAPQAASGGGGGFMRSAMATAAGVAGGIAVGSMIGNMMRGGGSHGAGAPHSASDSMTPLPNYQEASSNDQGGTYASTSSPQYQNASDNDQGYQSDEEADAETDAEVESDGGGWGGGSDIET